MKFLGRDKDHYNIFYEKNKNVWGNEPLDILRESIKLFDQNDTFLDLGCGQGRNTFFMASEGFNVEAVDFSENALVQIREYAVSKGINNIKTRCCDLLNLESNIESGIVGVINLVSLWERKKALDFIERLKKGMKKGAHIILTGYLKDDIFYVENFNGLFFNNNELLELFSEFEIKIYKEDTFTEGPHEGYNFSHKHSFCKIVAQKK